RDDRCATGCRLVHPRHKTGVGEPLRDLLGGGAFVARRVRGVDTDQVATQRDNVVVGRVSEAGIGVAHQPLPDPIRLLSNVNSCVMLTAVAPDGAVIGPPERSKVRTTGKCSPALVSPGLANCVRSTVSFDNVPSLTHASALIATSGSDVVFTLLSKNVVVGMFVVSACSRSPTSFLDCAVNCRWSP